MGWLALLLVPFSLVIGIAWWARRGEAKSDRPGERTCAVFRAPSADVLRDGGDPPGEALMLVIAAALNDDGVATDAPGPGEHGWAVKAHAARAYIELVAIPETEGAWAITVLDPSSGGPGPIAVAQKVDRAIRAVKDATGVRWQKREAFDPADASAGAEHPTD